MFSLQKISWNHHRWHYSLHSWYNEARFIYWISLKNKVGVKWISEKRYLALQIDKNSYSYISCCPFTGMNIKHCIYACFGFKRIKAWGPGSIYVLVSSATFSSHNALSYFLVPRHLLNQCADLLSIQLLEPNSLERGDDIFHGLFVLYDFNKCLTFNT